MSGIPGAGPRWLPWALIPMSLLSNPAAAVPWGSYFFRDFSVGLIPLKDFAARELAAGRLPLWNPYIHEGTFFTPVFLYAGDVLHVLWPSPAFISWLLTLHLPLAALAMYVLARDLGASRRGAFVAGAVFSLGGLAVSSVNLYVNLQALAWTPAIAAGLRRAALLGGRWVVAAALVLGASLPLLAVEFLGQGVALGIALALLDHPSRGALLRLLTALSLGVGLTALPVSLTLAMLPETARGVGFAAADALEGEMPPVALIQTFVLGLLGPPWSPFEGWWAPFFRHGSPFFLTLYLGPLTLALAALGVGSLPRPFRLLFLGGVLLSVWFALGSAGGLAPLLQLLPGARSFRSPAKAFLFCHLTVALLAGFGFDRLARRSGWGVFGAACALLGVSAGGLAALLVWAPGTLARWVGLAPEILARPRLFAASEAMQAGLLALAGVMVATGVHWGARLRGSLGAMLVAAVALVDLTRAGAGVNPQVPSSFYELLPELASQVAGQRDRGRLFTYGIQWSPAFREHLRRRPDRPSRWIFWVNRQMLTPLTNMLDRVESAETPDLLGWVIPVPELLPGDYDPAAIARILPRLRSAAVSRVLSLDPLRHEGLELLARHPLPGSELAVHVYALQQPVPIASFACRTLPVSSQEQAFRAATSTGFDHGQVALEQHVPEPSCVAAGVSGGPTEPTREAYDVESDGAGYLVVRRGFARGWSARVDGSPEPVLRANGKYRAVRVPAGRHRVEMEYRAPGMAVGTTLFLASVLATALLWVRARRSA